MIEHDPLCPSHDNCSPDPWGDRTYDECRFDGIPLTCRRCERRCYCDEYALVRADEREKAAQRMCDSWNAGPDLFSRLIDAVRGES